MKRALPALVMLLVAIKPCGAENRAATPPVAANPVQVEMQLLTAALQTAVRSIGVGDVREVAHALHQVHEAKQATAAAIAGGRYRPPKNGDRIARFRELDEAFHSDLASIVAASHANDVAGTAEAVGKALRACNGCHEEFRPRPTEGF